MKLFAPFFVLLLLTAGCIHVHKSWFHVLNGNEEACAQVGYCSATAGTVVIGDTRCYTQDVTMTQPIDNKDLIYADGTPCTWQRIHE